MSAVLSRIATWFGFGGYHADQRHRGHRHNHGHAHGTVDPKLATTAAGIRAIKSSFAILALTAALQLGVVVTSGSVALLADTIHNVGDATTAVPLWIAFLLARRKPSKTFTYGLGRVEDLAGLAIVLIILASALVAGYEAIDRLIHPMVMGAIGWVTAAGIIGFLGNEAVAIFRIRVGRAINSAALIADGYHARTDGLTSLAVVIGAAGVWLGFPLADPIVGLAITLVILGIVWQSARAVFTRILDGVEPGIIDEIHHAAKHVPGIERVTGARARWIGHSLHIDVTIAVDGSAPLAAVERTTAALREEFQEHLPALASTSIQLVAAIADDRRGRAD